MTENDFMSKIAGAQKLCQMDAQKQIKRSAKAGQMMNEGYSDDSDWDRMFLSDAAYGSSSVPTQEINKSDMVISEARVEKSRVPDFIKQSMVNEVIDRTALEDNPLNRMDFSKMEKPTPVRRQVNEAVVPTTPNVVNSGIDYTIIKAIINECIESKFKEYGIGKSSLNEGSLKTVYLKGGEIKLVDNSGNIYSAKLEKKGNLNESRK